MKLPTAAIEVAAFEAVEFQKHKHNLARNCVTNKFWTEKKQKPEQSDQKNQSYPLKV